MTDKAVANALNRLFSDIIERHFASLGVLPKKGIRIDTDSHLEDCINDSLHGDDQPALPCADCKTEKNCKNTLRHWSTAYDACYRYALEAGFSIEQLQGIAVNRASRHPDDDITVDYLVLILKHIDPFGEIADEDWDNYMKFGRAAADEMKQQKQHSGILDFLEDDDMDEITIEQVGGLLAEHHELSSGRHCSEHGRMWRFGDRYWELLLARWRIDLPVRVFMPLLTRGVSQSYLNTLAETYLPRLKRAMSRQGLKTTDSTPSGFPQNSEDFIS